VSAEIVVRLEDVYFVTFGKEPRHQHAADATSNDSNSHGELASGGRVFEAVH
jgi:hypothetical protein